MEKQIGEFLMSPEEFKALEENYKYRVANGTFKDPTAPKKAPPKQKGKGGMLTSFISEGGGFAGAAKGAAMGSFAGPGGILLGALLGGAAGGFAGRLAENKIRDDEFRVGDALKEGAISGVMGAGPGRLLKGANAIRTGTNLTEALTVGQKAAQGGTGLLGKVRGNLEDKASSSFLKLTPSQSQKLLDDGIDPTDLAKRAATFGRSPDEIIGATGKGGRLQSAIKEQEDVISGVTSKASNVRLSADDLVKNLEAERVKLSSELGGADKARKLGEIIEQVKVKYPNGATPEEARSILRSGNQRFGKSALEDSNDAIATAAQKAETNWARNGLKSNFPDIEKALDEEQALIQTRELLSRARGVNKTGGFKLGRAEVTRPGSYLDPLLNSNAISSRVLKNGAKKDGVQAAQGSLKNPYKAGAIASRVGTGTPLVNALTGNTAPAVAEDTELQALQAELAGQGQIDPTTGMPLDQALMQEPQADPNDPFNPANLQANIQQMMANGATQKDLASYLDMVQQMQDINAAANPQGKAPSAAALKQSETANAGFRSLAEIEQIIQGGGVPKGTVVAGRGMLGGLGQNVLGTASYDAAADNVADTMVRLRTGAAATKEELALYRRMLPQAFDSPDVQRQKMNAVRTYLQNLSSTPAAGIDQADLLTALGA